MDDVTQQTRVAGFRLLLESDRAVSAAQIAQVLFFPDDGGSVKTIDDWCSNANFFETREAALSWSARKMEGEVIELNEARRRSLAHWSPLLSANRGIESR